MYPLHVPVSCAQARAADLEATRTHRIPSLVLMEHAGRGLAMLAAERCPPGGIVVTLCGPGNNGGDGYACARFLRSFGILVRVVRASATPPPEADAALEHDLACAGFPHVIAATEADEGLLVQALDGASVVVDALFGIGLSRPLRPPYPRFIEIVNASDVVRIAADVPSGLDADTGEPRSVAVRAHVTAAMGLPKQGCFTDVGRPYAGSVVEVDIGLPRGIHERDLA